MSRDKRLLLALGALLAGPFVTWLLFPSSGFESRTSGILVMLGPTAIGLSACVVLLSQPANTPAEALAVAPLSSDDETRDDDDDDPKTREANPSRPTSGVIVALALVWLLVLLLAFLMSFAPTGPG